MILTQRRRDAKRMKTVFPIVLVASQLLFGSACTSFEEVSLEKASAIEVTDLGVEQRFGESIPERRIYTGQVVEEVLEILERRQLVSTTNFVTVVQGPVTLRTFEEVEAETLINFFTLKGNDIWNHKASWILNEEDAAELWRILELRSHAENL